LSTPIRSRRAISVSRSARPGRRSIETIDASLPVSSSRFWPANLTRFEAAKIKWEHRKQRHIGWNIKAGGGKYIRALLGTQLATIETGLLTQEYDFTNKVARFTYLAGTEIDAPAIKAYCSDLTEDGPPRQIEVYVGDQQIQI